MPRKSKKSAPPPIEIPSSPSNDFPEVPPLSPLGRDAIFNRNGSATYGIGGSSAIGSIAYEMAREGIQIIWNCDELRIMVRKLLGKGEIKVVELHRALHVSPKNYYPWMRAKGTTAGLAELMYKKLHRFFLDREKAGLWVPEVSDEEYEDNHSENNDDADSDENEADPEVISIASDDDNDPEGEKENRPETTDETTKYNCHQIRCKITMFIAEDGLSIDEFIRKLGVPARSFHSFMKQKGPHAGVRNQTYKAAHEFFADRDWVEAQAAEVVGKAKLAAIKSAERRSLQSSLSKTPQKQTTKSNKKSDAASAIVLAMSTLPSLEGEEDSSVPIYATCDDIRKQIASHLRQPGVTQASFCRALTACQGSDPSRFHGKGHGGPVQSVQLQSFLNKTGSMAGNTSKVFYTAYVFFEKLRLKEGKEKSEQRLEMEDIWEDKGGVDTKKVSGNLRLIGSADGPGWAWDEYGRPRTIGGFNW